MKLYVAAVTKKPPASNVFKTVQNAMGDKMLAAKLGFMQSIAIQFEPYKVSNQQTVASFHVPRFVSSVA